MANAEMIGLLCAGSVKYHEIRGGGAGGALSRAELAGKLSGLSTPAMHLALAKYGCDVDSERKLLAHIRVWAAGVAIRESWKIVRGRPTLLNMCVISVFEVIRPNRCVKCSGRGQVSFKVCPVCEGIGFKKLSGRNMAEAIGVDKNEYISKWRPRYEQIYAYVNKLEDDVMVTLGKADRETIVNHTETA